MEKITTNFNTIPIFTISPTEGTILPREKFNVSVTFKPDHTSPLPFTKTFQINVPDQAEEHRITLQVIRKDQKYLEI